MYRSAAGNGRANPAEASPEEGHKDDRDRSTAAGGQAPELGLFSLERRGLWGDPTAAFPHLQGACERAAEGLFVRAASGKTG